MPFNSGLSAGEQQGDSSAELLAFLKDIRESKKDNTSNPPSPEVDASLLGVYASLFGIAAISGYSMPGPKTFIDQKNNKQAITKMSWLISSIKNNLTKKSKTHPSMTKNPKGATKEATKKSKTPPSMTKNPKEATKEATKKSKIHVSMTINPKEATKKTEANIPSAAAATTPTMAPSATTPTIASPSENLPGTNGKVTNIRSEITLAENTIKSIMGIYNTVIKTFDKEKFKTATDLIKDMDFATAITGLLTKFTSLADGLGLKEEDFTIEKGVVVFTGTRGKLGLVIKSLESIPTFLGKFSEDLAEKDKVLSKVSVLPFDVSIVSMWNKFTSLADKLDLKESDFKKDGWNGMVLSGSAGRMGIVIEALKAIPTFINEFSSDLVSNYKYFAIASVLPYSGMIIRFIKKFEKISKYIGKKGIGITLGKEGNVIKTDSGNPSVFSTVMSNLMEIPKFVEAFGVKLFGSYFALLIATKLPIGTRIKQFLDKTVKAFTNNKGGFHPTTQKGLEALKNYVDIIKSFSKDLVKQFPYFLMATSLPYGMKLRHILKILNKLDLAGLAKLKEFTTDFTFFLGNISIAIVDFYTKTKAIEIKTMNTMITFMDSLSTSIVKLNKYSDKAIISKGNSMKMFLESLATGLATSNRLLTGGLWGFRMLTDTIADFIKTMGKMLIGIALIPVALIFLKFVKNQVIGLFDHLGGVKKSKEVKHGIHSFKEVVHALMMFSGAMIVLAATAILLPVIIIYIAVIAGIIMLLSLIGGKKIQREVKEGAQTLRKISLSLLLFSLTIAAMAFIFTIVPISGILKAFLALGLITLNLILIGKLHKHINKGAGSLALMSLSLLLFAVAAFIYFSAIQAFPITTILIAGLVLFMMIGLALLSKLLSWKDILITSVYFILMGVALIVFGYGLGLMMNSVKDMTWEKFGMVFALLGGIILLGVLFGLLLMTGVGFLVFLLPVFLILMGIAFVIFGFGLLLVAKAMNMFTQEKVDLLFSLMKTLVKVFAIAGIALPLLVLGVAGIALISGGLIILSFSLLKLGQGLSVIEKATKGSTLLQRDKNGHTGLYNLFSSLVGIAGLLAKNVLAFIVAGKSAKSIITMGKSFKALAIGLTFIKKIQDYRLNPHQISSTINSILKVFANIKAGAVSKGINSVLTIGKALNAVAGGLISFDKATKSLDLSGSLVKGKWMPNANSLGARIANVVGVISESFASIGKSGNDSQSILKAYFGLDFDQADVKIGINAVMKVDKALSSVANGLETFFKKTQKLDLTKNGKVVSSIRTVIGLIMSQFANIGADKNLSVFKLVFGKDFSKSNVEQGVQIVNNYGKALLSISEGLEKFSRINRAKAKMWNFTKLIKSAMYGLIQIFADKNLDLKKLKKDVQRLKEVADFLTPLAQNFENLSKQKIDPTSVNQVLGILNSFFGSKLIKTVLRMQESGNTKMLKTGAKDLEDFTSRLSTITKSLASVNGMSMKLANWKVGGEYASNYIQFWMQRISAISGNNSMWGLAFPNLAKVKALTQKDYQKGVKNLKTLAGGLVKFSDIMKKFDISKLDLSNFDKIVNFTTQMTKMTNPLRDIATSFDKIANAINTLSKNLDVSVAALNGATADEIKVNLEKVQQKKAEKEKAARQESETYKKQAQSGNDTQALILSEILEALNILVARTSF